MKPLMAILFGLFALSFCMNLQLEKRVKILEQSQLRISGDIQNLYDDSTKNSDSISKISDAEQAIANTMTIMNRSIIDTEIGVINNQQALAHTRKQMLSGYGTSGWVAGPTQ